MSLNDLADGLLTSFEREEARNAQSDETVRPIIVNGMMELWQLLELIGAEHVVKQVRKWRIRFGVSWTANCVLVHPKKMVTRGEATRALEAHNLRPATFLEILTFAATYPELLWQYPIVALTETVVDEEICDLAVAKVAGHTGVSWVSSKQFNEIVRFLGVVKR